MIHLLRWFCPFLNGLGLGLAAMFLHECGHIVTALTLGVPVKKLGIRWTRGLYTIRESGSAYQNLLIAAAGPLVNVLLISTEPWLRLFSMANLCYALGNMLPIDGSDGMRVAKCWQQIRERTTAS